MELPKPSAGAYRPRLHMHTAPTAPPQNCRSDSDIDAPRKCRSDSDIDAGSDCSTDLPKREPLVLQRTVKALLNKISPENERFILPQFANLHVESVKDLATISRLIVDKALDDPFYSDVYVSCIETMTMCPWLESPDESVGSSDGEGDRVLLPPTMSGKLYAGQRDSFHTIMLQYCTTRLQLFLAGMLKDDNEPEVFDLSDDAVLASSVRRRRIRACMRFMGNLFLRKVVPSATFYGFLHTLVEPAPGSLEKSPPKSWIECACELLRTVGKKCMSSTLDKDKIRDVTRRLSLWSDRRAVASGCPIYPARIRFMIQDVVEANEKGWPDELIASAKRL
jgi:hypothetical protein